MDECRGCGAENRDGAFFCASCGTSLIPPCPRCGNKVAPSARFCDACGLPLTDDHQRAQQNRKVVTVLFADLSGSTSAQERMDPEAVRRWMDRYYAAMRGEIERHGGRIVKFIGDGVMAVFGVPAVREDDAHRALEAAVAMHDAFGSLDGDLGLRIGINTGEVVVTADDDDVVGDAVNVAARLEAAAASGETVVGEATFRLVRSSAQLRALPPLELKGKAEPVQAYRLIALEHGGDDRGASTFVGRTEELGRLMVLLEETRKAAGARMATIVGSPGVGKTRLARELAAVAALDARVVEMRCDPAAATTYGPIAEALRIAAAVDEEASDETILASLKALFDEDLAERDRIASVVASVLGVGDLGKPEETFWAVRRLVESAARQRPMVLFFDDVHWAEPLLLDLIENLAEWIDDAPVLLVLTARPELRDLRPALVDDARRSNVVIHLEGLAEDESRRLACEVLGAEWLPDALFDRITEASGGNPLFVGELVRMLVDDGVLVRDGDGWTTTVDLHDIDVPLTIHALLTARIDRLDDAERAVLEAASALGKTFYRGAVAEVVADDVRADLDGVLERLRRKELVEPAGTYWIDEPVLRFHHVLIRDAAYRRLLMEARAELHERLASWLESKVGDAVEHDDLIGYQLEQAHLLRSDLGDPNPALGARAAARLGAAGRRALDADDNLAAASLLGRALACLEPGDPAAGQIAIDRCEAIVTAGDVAEASRAVADLAALPRVDPRVAGWVTCFQAQIDGLVGSSSLAAVVGELAAVADQLHELGDVAGAAKAHAVRADALSRLGRIGESERALDEALGAARRAGDRRRATAVLAGAPVAALWGPNPVTRASGRCLDVVRVLRITSSSPAVEASSLRCQAVLESLRGRASAGRRMLRSARAALEELGDRLGLLELEVAEGTVAALAGDLDAAEAHLRRAHDGLERLGIGAGAALARALLAEVLVRTGDIEAALALTDDLDATAGGDLRTAIAMRSVRADALAATGDLVAARSLAEDAVALAAPTDALIDHAKALAALSRVLRAAGDDDAADAHARHALELCERKEASVLADQARALVPDRRTVDHAPRTGHLAAHSPGPLETLEEPAEPGGANRAWRVYELTCEALAQGDWSTIARWYRDDVVLLDRRPVVGGGVEFRGRDEALAASRAIHQVGVRAIDTRLVAARGDRLSLGHATLRGAPEGPEDGVVEVLQLLEVDASGRYVQSDTYDVAQLDEALAELDRRAAGDDAASGTGEPASGEVSNQATATHERLWRAVDDRDIAAMSATIAPTMVAVDERTLIGAGLTMGADEMEAVARALAEVMDTAGGSVSWSALATRDERWCLCRIEVAGEQGGTVALQVCEVDDAGLITRLDSFDPEQLDDAYERLDAWFLQGCPDDTEAYRVSMRVMRACNRRDWGGLDSLLADDFELVDHRPVSFGSTDREGFLLVQQTIAEQAPESRHAVTAIQGRGATWACGSLDISGIDEFGGGFSTSVWLLAHVRDGRWSTLEAFGDLDAARVRMAELDERSVTGAGGTEPAAHGNGASRVHDRLFVSMGAEDADSLAALCSDGVVFRDRRPVIGGVEAVGRDRVSEVAASLQVHRAEVRSQPVATRGERLALTLDTLRYPEHGVEAGLLVLTEVDERGLVCRLESFDVAQRDEALALLDELHGAGWAAEERDASRSFARLAAAVSDRDVDAVMALYAPDAELVDHRSVVGGGVHATGDELRQVAQALFDVGTSRVTSALVARRGDRLELRRATYSGTRTEVETFTLVEVDASGLVRRLELFAIDQLDDAYARLDEHFLAGAGGRSRAWITYSTACDALNRKDMDAFGALMDDRALARDHRPLGWGTVEGESFASMMASMFERTVDARWRLIEDIAMADDVVCVRVQSGGSSPDGGEFLIDAIAVLRVDPVTGRPRTLDQFAVEDLDRALELYARPSLRSE